MQLSNEIITASPDAVHIENDHLFWTTAPSAELADSIQEFGQTTPLLAQETDAGLVLIAGHARLVVLKDQDTPVLVRLVENADAIGKGLLYLADNGHRTMDDGMRLAALSYFRPLMDEKQLRKDIFPRLGIKPKGKDSRLLMEWLALPNAWQALLAKGHVPLPAASTLTRMNDTDRTALEPLFSNFSWSRSNAVNIINWLYETSKMQRCTLADAMEKANIPTILKQGLSPKDSIAKLCAAAKATRYPELTNLQAQFASLAREISAGTNWRITEPNNFETGGAELSIQVKNPDQLAKAVAELETMEKASSWAKIWNMGGKNE